MEDIRVGGKEPLVYLFLISSFKSSASSAPNFTGAVEPAEAIGFDGGGLFSIKASCKAGAAVLDFEEPRGGGGPRLDVPPVRTVMMCIDDCCLVEWISTEFKDLGSCQLMTSHEILAPPAAKSPPNYFYSLYNIQT